jgi:PKD repeat protein
VNAPLQFIDSSSVTGSSLISWNWQFGSMGSSTQQNPVVTFTSSGTYSVTLSVTSAQGCTGSSAQSVQVMPLPVPAFSFYPQYGPLPLNVSFTNQSLGASNYLWSFGDGGQSTFVNPSHTYQNTGLYPVKLVSETKFGCKDSLTENLTIDVTVLDVAVEAVGVIQQPNALQVYAKLFNAGTIDANSIQLSAYLDDGTPVLETWTDTLKRQELHTYLFNSSLEILANKKHNIVCVDVVRVNGRTDDVLSNNHSCTAITSDFTLLNPFPNPANDDIYFLFVLPQDGTINAEIYDARGRKVESFEENAFKGLNQIIYNTLNLSRGTYFLKLYYKEASLGKMFMKE